MGYFEKIEGHKQFIKVLIGIIIALLLVNIVIVKSLITVASNKNISIQVPQFMESGEYIIGSTFASDNVYKMWVKVWIQDIASFSYQNIREKYQNIYPFLDLQTAHKSKADLARFIEFVEKNFIQQDFKISEITTKKLPGGYVKVIAYGTVQRKIGSSKDQLNGMRYAYELVTFVKNGQIYIKSIKTSFYALVDKDQKDKLKSNAFVNFEDIIQ